jgi:hypothetical protein
MCVYIYICMYVCMLRDMCMYIYIFHIHTHQEHLQANKMPCSRCHSLRNIHTHTHIHTYISGAFASQQNALLMTPQPQKPAFGFSQFGVSSPGMYVCMSVCLHIYEPVCLYMYVCMHVLHVQVAWCVCMYAYM